MPATQRSAIFIDGANLYATTKALGFDIDYKKLLKEFQSRENLLRAFYYTAMIEDQEYSSIRPLVGPQTAVISFQNGVQKDDALREAFGAEAVMGGAASRRAVTMRKWPGDH